MIGFGKARSTGSYRNPVCPLLNALQLPRYTEQPSSQGLIDPIERPYRPKDSSSWESRQSDQTTPGSSSQRVAKPNALMFFHMPMRESYYGADRDPATNWPLDTGLKKTEPPGAAKGNDGMFEKGILGAKESDHVKDGAIPEVKVVGNGHCHCMWFLRVLFDIPFTDRDAVTENCRRVSGVWLCFGGGGSYSGYGRVGYVAPSYPMLSHLLTAGVRIDSIADSECTISRTMERPSGPGSAPRQTSSLIP